MMAVTVMTMISPDIILTEVKRATDIRKSGNDGWYVFRTAPCCGKGGKVAFHPSIGWTCHHCHRKGTMRTFAAFLREHGLDVSWADSYDFSRFEFNLGNLFVEEGVKDTCVDIPMPFESHPCTRERMPSYLTKDRDFPADLIMAMGFRYCTSGYYSGRIIVPLETGPHSAFLAYATVRDSDIKKVLYPSGCQIGQFLWPFNFVLNEDPSLVVLCEGVTDALRIMCHALVGGKELGLPLALLGKNLSRHQARALQALPRSCEIAVCLDADTDEEVRSWGHDTMRKLIPYVGSSRLSVMDLSHIKKLPISSDLRAHPINTIDPDTITDVNDWRMVVESRISAQVCLV